jgi:hypothetical protein
MNVELIWGIGSSTSARDYFGTADAAMASESLLRRIERSRCQRCWTEDGTAVVHYAAVLVLRIRAKLN